MPKKWAQFRFQFAPSSKNPPPFNVSKRLLTRSQREGESEKDVVVEASVDGEEDQQDGDRDEAQDEEELEHQPKYQNSTMSEDFRPGRQADDDDKKGQKSEPIR